MLAALIPFSMLLAQQAPTASSNGWGILTEINMGSTAPTIPNELVKATRAGQKDLWAQLRIDELEGAVLILTMRGCEQQITDYRQHVSMPRHQSAAAEIEAIRSQAIKLFDVLEDRCGLPSEAAETFMTGFEPLYREIYERNRPGR